jgi:3-methyladenine DNA glycosylase AlkD
MQYKHIITLIRSQYNAKNIAGMARFGINTKNKTYGASMPFIRKLGKQIGHDHDLALKLWDSGVHEARILAGIIDEKDKVTSEQMDSWTADFDSWDICDQVCMNLYRWTKYAYKKAFKWTKSNKEFIKRAGFALMAALASGDKKATDRQFEQFYPIIKKGSTDERNFVRKAVNWALRQIGKRNRALRRSAIKAAKEILKIDSKAARWIASDALRELSSI